MQVQHPPSKNGPLEFPPVTRFVGDLCFVLCCGSVTLYGAHVALFVPSLCWDTDSRDTGGAHPRLPQITHQRNLLWSVTLRSSKLQQRWTNPGKVKEHKYLPSSFLLRWATVL